MVILWQLLLALTGTPTVSAQTTTTTSQYVPVGLDNGTFWGTSSGPINSFLGIPYAKSPVGDLRFRLPVANSPYSGDYDATFFSVACPQQVSTLQSPPSGLEALDPFFLLGYIGIQAGPWGEDCLTLNVWAPANVTNDAKLPVLAWIYGGGFQDGSTQAYDPTAIIERSIQMGQPIVFVSMNYRLSAFGFLASKEVQQAGLGNIGLHDQRQALRWIQKYISAFNGDPTKVTLWGQSAGAISISLQMLANGGDTEGLFHAAFMNSGSPNPVGDLTRGQKYYDQIVQTTGCAHARDTLQCLREVPYITLKAAADQTPHFLSYQSTNLAWNAWADGTFILDDPQKLVLNGSVANIPFINGDCDDEGTEFAMFSLNTTTDAEAQDYIHTNYLPGASSAQMAKLMTLYPQDPAQGSPYDTGTANAVTPQFKRIAAFGGDFIYHGPRRLFLQHRADKQSTWSYMFKKGKTAFAPLGSYHSSDLPDFFSSGGQMIDYLINFVNHFDPNGQNLTAWPKYTTAAPALLTLDDSAMPFSLTNDTFRKEAIEYVVELGLQYPL